VTDPVGLRQRKRQERHRRIEAAALDLFETRGFEATTIEDIARAADIAPRTFFSYFPTKEDVVLADYADRLNRIIDELDRRPTNEAPWAALQAAFAAVAIDYQSQRSALIRRFTIMIDAPSVYARSLQLQAGWEDTLSETIAVRAGTDSADPAPRLLAAAGLAAMRASLRHWLETGHKEPLPDIVGEAFTRLSEGLGPGPTAD